LLVVVAIIALLVAILVPALEGARSLAQRAACGSNLHQLIVGPVLFANDHDGKLFRHPGLGWDLEMGAWPSNLTSHIKCYDPENVLLLTYFAGTKDIFYCPGNPLRADTCTRWPGAEPDRKPAWGYHHWKDPPDVYTCEFTYMLIANVQTIRPDPDLEIIPTVLTDNPNLVVWADRDWFTESGYPHPHFADGGAWWTGNHPGLWWLYTPGVKELDGRNAARLDGSVSWDEFDDEMKHKIMFQWTTFLAF